MAVYAFRLRGDLNLPLLQGCFDTVICRHSALRARIAESDGVTLMEVDETCGHRLRSEVVSGVSTADIEQNARRAVEDLCELRIDLMSGPLWRVRLLRLGEEEHWLVLAMHRLIGDCISIDQTYREIWALYCESQLGRASPLYHPAQYSDYALAQERTALEWHRRHQAYWDERLAGASPVRWPGDVDRPADGAALGKARCLLGTSLSDDLRELAKTSRTLAATLLMTIYAVVLWRWSGQTNFVLPFNVAGRQSEHKSAIGYFSYALLLRVQLTGNETFSELLRALGKEFFSGLSHQDYGRMAAQYPELLEGTLFQWVTWHPDDKPTLTSQPSHPLKQGIDRVSVRDFGEGLTIVPPCVTGVEITFFDTTEGIHGIASYRADLFTSETMERLMRDVCSVARIFVNNPEGCIAQLGAGRGNIDATTEQHTGACP